jgi:hypothetical protein
MLADVVKKVAKASRAHPSPAEPPSATTLAFLKKHRVPPKLVKRLTACSGSSSL